jgi:hypothetical protein
VALGAKLNDSSIIKSLKSEDLTILNSSGTRGVPKLLMSKSDVPPPLMLCTDITASGTVVPPDGMVRKRVVEIEDQRKAGLKQPPSMYTSVTTPLDVWLVPGHAGYKPPTLFYKAPQALPYDFIIKLPEAGLEMEETLTTARVEPRVVRLLERSGINLRQNCRLPPPPAICEEWWEEIEKTARKNKKKTN